MTISTIYRVDLTVPDHVSDFIRSTRLGAQFDADVIAALKGMATLDSSKYANHELWAEACQQNVTDVLSKYISLEKARPRVPKELRPVILRVGFLGEDGYLNPKTVRWVAQERCTAGHCPTCTPEWAWTMAQQHANKLNEKERKP